MKPEFLDGARHSTRLLARGIAGVLGLTIAWTLAQGDGWAFHIPAFVLLGSITAAVIAYVRAKSSRSPLPAGTVAFWGLGGGELTGALASAALTGNPAFAPVFGIALVSGLGVGLLAFAAELSKRTRYEGHAES